MTPKATRKPATPASLAPGQSRCPTLRMHAHSAGALLIGKVLQTVLTEQNISRVLAVVTDSQRYDEAREQGLTRQDLQEVRENPERFVLAAESRAFLGRFITEIQVYAETAVVHYSISLPEDSPLAGMRREEIKLPEEVLARSTATGTCPPPMATHVRHPRYLQGPQARG